jgi:hypothetical protein
VPAAASAGSGVAEAVVEKKLVKSSAVLDKLPSADRTAVVCPSDHARIHKQDRIQNQKHIIRQ